MLLALAALPAVMADEGESYRAYPLRHKQVAEIEPKLVGLMRDLKPEPQIVLDQRGNQILLRGSAQAHEIARQYLESIDRAPVPPGEPQPAVVQGYRIEPRRLNDVFRDLQARFGDRPQVRLTSDPETSQVIVLAPPDVHAAITAELGLPPAPTAPPPPARFPPSSTAPSVPTEQTVAVTKIPLPRMEQQLRHLLGSRLEPRGGRATTEPDFVIVRGPRRAHLLMQPATHAIRIVGDPQLVAQLARLVQALDRPENGAGQSEPTIRVIPVHSADPNKVQEAVDAYRSGSPPPNQQGQRNASPPVPQTSLHQGRLRLPVALAQHTEPVADVPLPNGRLPAEELPNGQPPDAMPFQGEVEPRLRQLGDRVQIETLPDLDVIILRGRDPDVDEVARIIAEIERLSAETVPVIDLYQLRHVNCMALVTIVDLVAVDLIGGRQGKIHITPLIKPNAILLIGWGEAVTAMKELIAKLDQPVSAESQLRVYRLRHESVARAAATVEDVFRSPQGMAARVVVTPDVRTNSLIVRAAPGDLKELELLISRIDQGDSGLVNQARIFKLKNTLATELATTLTSAIAAAAGGVQRERSTVLELITADVEGRRLLRSGVLSDVQITPDPHTNSLMVAAPAESMDLLSALIEQLDSPTAVAQIKVFKIVNGDAANLIEMLRVLLPSQLMVAGPQLAGAEGETTLVPVRFSLDTRTNSIIATGSQGDLAIIEALLLRLDEDDVAERMNTVYRLKNAPAIDVAGAINELLRSRRVIEQATPGMRSAFELVEREVIVVPEPVSNSLIISATPRYYEEVLRVVEDLDKQPAQVMIQVVIAEVLLDDFDEFGIELGLQDSVLFDRSLLSALQTIRKVTTTETLTGTTRVEEDTIIAANNTPGFAFNNQPLGNAGSDRAFASSSQVGTQGLSSFNVGRMNSQLGYGGFVLSASSESVSMLVRALQQSRRMEVLGRPQIMTLDNQPAFIQVGERVPRITGSRFDANAQTNTVELENTGLILGVTPRISPEGLVVMEIDAEKSKVGREEDGIPVSVVQGNVIRAPKIAVTTAQTTVSAASGETIVLGGLITKDSLVVRRRVPYLSSIPILGNLFRYDSNSTIRSELLIILTPQVIRNQQDLERLKMAEAARMSWCLADVHEIHGPTGIYEDCDPSPWNGQGEVIYPDINPGGLEPGTFTPRGVPMDTLELSPSPAELDPNAAPGPVSPVPRDRPAPTAPLPPPVRPLSYQSVEPGSPPAGGNPTWESAWFPPAGESLPSAPPYRTTP
jgi:general secretion pathway protein D